MRETLKELMTSLQMGYQPRGAVKDDPEGTHWLIQMRDVSAEGVVDATSLARFMPERTPDPYVVRDGDILLQIRGWSHWAAVVRGLDEWTVASNHFYIMRADTNRVVPEYVAWYINESPAQNYLNRGAHGAGNVTVVPKAVLEETEVPVPPLSVQEHIAALAGLQWKEKRLMEQLHTKRKLLVSATCMQAAEGSKLTKGTSNHD